MLVSIVKFKIIVQDVVNSSINWQLYHYCNHFSSLIIILKLCLFWFLVDKKKKHSQHKTGPKHCDRQLISAWAVKRMWNRDIIIFFPAFMKNVKKKTCSGFQCDPLWRQRKWLQQPEPGIAWPQPEDNKTVIIKQDMRQMKKIRLFFISPTRQDRIR